MGWAPRFGNPWDKEEDQTSLLDHQTWLEGKLDDKFFGGMRLFPMLLSSTIAHESLALTVG